MSNIVDIEKGLVLCPYKKGPNKESTPKTCASRYYQAQKTIKRGSFKNNSLATTVADCKDCKIGEELYGKGIMDKQYKKSIGFPIASIPDKKKKEEEKPKPPKGKPKYKINNIDLWVVPSRQLERQKYPFLQDISGKVIGLVCSNCEYDKLLKDFEKGMYICKDCMSKLLLNKAKPIKETKDIKRDQIPYSVKYKISDIEVIPIKNKSGRKAKYPYLADKDGNILGKICSSCKFPKASNEFYKGQSMCKKCFTEKYETPKYRNSNKKTKAKYNTSQIKSINEKESSTTSNAIEDFKNAIEDIKNQSAIKFTKAQEEYIILLVNDIVNKKTNEIVDTFTNTLNSIIKGGL